MAEQLVAMTRLQQPTSLIQMRMGAGLASQLPSAPPRCQVSLIGEVQLDPTREFMHQVFSPYL